MPKYLIRASYTAEVEEGTYLLHSLVENSDPQDEEVSLFTDPNIVVSKDTEIVTLQEGQNTLATAEQLLTSSAAVAAE